MYHKKMKYSKPKLSLSLILINHHINCDKDNVYQAYCNLTLKQIKTGIDAWITNPKVKQQMQSLIAAAASHFNSQESHLSESQKQRLLYEIEYMKKAISTKNISELVNLTKQKDSDRAIDQPDKDKKYPYQFEISHKAIMLSRKNFGHFNILQFYGVAAYEFMHLSKEEKKQATELKDLLDNRDTNETKLQDTVNGYDQKAKDPGLRSQMKRIDQGAITDGKLQNFGEIEKNLKNWEEYIAQPDRVITTKPSNAEDFKNRQRRYVSYILLNRIRQQLKEAPNICAKKSREIQKQIGFALKQANSANKNIHITNVINELKKLKQQLPAQNNNPSEEENTLFNFREYQKIMELLSYAQYGIVTESDFSLKSTDFFGRNDKAQITQQITALENAQFHLFKTYLRNKRNNNHCPNKGRSRTNADNHIDQNTVTNEQRPHNATGSNTQTGNRQRAHNTGPNAQISSEQRPHDTNPNPQQKNSNKKSENHTKRNVIIGITIVISTISIATAIWLWKKNLNKTKNNV